MKLRFVHRRSKKRHGRFESSVRLARVVVLFPLILATACACPAPVEQCNEPETQPIGTRLGLLYPGGSTVTRLAGLDLLAPHGDSMFGTWDETYDFRVEENGTVHVKAEQVETWASGWKTSSLIEWDIMERGGWLVHVKEPLGGGKPIVRRLDAPLALGVGDSWPVGRRLRATVVCVESVATFAGEVKGCARIDVSGRDVVETIWFEPGHCPVRVEWRSTETGALLVAGARFVNGPPSRRERLLAFDWAPASMRFEPTSE